MTIKINSKKLLLAFAKCQKAVSTSKIVPATENFHLVGKDGIIQISACNLEVSIETQIEADFKGEFNILAPAIKIMDFVKKLADQPLTITISETYLITIKHASGSANMQGEVGFDFPVIETTDGKVINISDLSTELYSVAYARGATEDPRTFIHSIWLDADKKECSFSAGDGFVMANSKVNGKFEPLKSLLPFNAVNILLSIAGDAELNISKNSITATISDTIVKFRLVDDKFPEIKKLIPSPVCTISVDRSDLLGALDRVVSFANQANKQVKLTADGAFLTVESSNPDLNEQSTETLTCDNGNFTISFRGNLMQAALSKFGSDTVNIGFTTEKTALLVTENNNDYFALIMPSI